MKQFISFYTCSIFLFTEIILQYFLLLNDNLIIVLIIDFLCINIKFYIYSKRFLVKISFYKKKYYTFALIKIP